MLQERQTAGAQPSADVAAEVGNAAAVSSDVEASDGGSATTHSEYDQSHPAKSACMLHEWIRLGV